MMSTVLVIGLLLAGTLSFFLSGMEVGVFGVNPGRIRHWMRQGRRGAAELHGYLQRPEEFFWTILVGNTLANFVAVTLGVVALLPVYADQPVLAVALLLGGVFVFHVLCDLLPKSLFHAYPNRLSLSLVGLFRVVHLLFRPLVALLWRASKLLVRWGGGGAVGRLSQSREELRMTIGETHPGLTSEEQRMIGRVLDLSTVKVGQLATRLDQATTVDAATRVEEVLRLCRERRLTRLPVWEAGGGERRIAGVISLKALLYAEDFDPHRKSGECLQPALFVAEDMPVEEALRRMQRSGQRLAILLGSGQREVGLVSLEDILRFLFGEVPA